MSELTHREVLYRALGVPDVLLPDNKQKAAAGKLAAQAPVPGASDPGASFQPGLQSDASLVLEAFCDIFEAGELDPLLGGYGRSTADVYAQRVANKACAAGSHEWQEGVVAMSKIVMEAVCSYIAEHPHGEPEAGSGAR